MYIPPKNSHKGENGKLLIVAGSPRYHGAALFSILAALRFVDKLYFMPAKTCPFLIQSVKHIPEAMVVQDVDIAKKVDAVLYGPGSDGAGLLNSLLNKNKRVVIDGDGLGEIEGKLPKESIITPHSGEFGGLEKKFSVNGTLEMAKGLGCVVLKKGPIDEVSDGKEVRKNSKGNPGLTKGGSGDALSGFIAALLCKNNPFEAAFFGVSAFTEAADRVYVKKGFYYRIEEVLEELPLVVKEKLGI